MKLAVSLVTSIKRSKTMLSQKKKKRNCKELLSTLSSDMFKSLKFKVHFITPFFNYQSDSSMAMRLQMNIIVISRNGLGDFSSSPVVKNLTSNVGGLGLIPGQGTKIPHSRGN